MLGVGSFVFLIRLAASIVCFRVCRLGRRGSRNLEDCQDLCPSLERVFILFRN